MTDRRCKEISVQPVVEKMSVFGRWKNDGLERRLREQRPVPPGKLVDEIVSRIEDARRAPAARPMLRRLGVAGVAAAVMLAILGAFGGVGSAASGVSGAAASTVNAVATLVSPAKTPSTTANPTSSNQANGNSGNGNGNGNGDECEDEDDDGAAEAEYCDDRVIICHVTPSGQRNTLTLPSQAAQHHLQNHPRDEPGACEDND